MHNHGQWTSVKNGHNATHYLPNKHYFELLNF